MRPLTTRSVISILAFLFTHSLCLVAPNHGRTITRGHTAAEGIINDPRVIPDVTLLDQDGKKVRFYTDLIRHKIVVVNFMFTTCEASCPLVGANLARLHTLLEDKAGSRVQLISITTDPATDTPTRLKAWAAKFGAKDNWRLVTGSQSSIDEITVALTGGVVRKGMHAPAIFIGDDTSGTWTRAYALDAPANLLAEVNNLRASNRAISTSVLSTPQTAPSQIGQWSNILNWGIIAVHMSLLPNGKVLIWPRYNPVNDDIPTGDNGARTPHARIWDPATGSFQAVPNSSTNFFCSGHTLLSDGSVFVNGGHHRDAGGTADKGVCDTNLLLWDGASGSWAQTADMNYERWYSTIVPLPNGDAMAIGGSYGGKSDIGLVNQPIEVWRHGGWTGFQQLVGRSSNLALQVDAVRMSNGLVEVFMVGRDGRMWRSSQRPDGSFPDDFAMKPVGVPNNLARRISVVALPGNRADVYMVGVDGRMWHSVQRSDGSFPNFAEHPVASPANIARDISAVRMADGHVELFMAGRDDGRIWRSSQGADGTFPDFANQPVASPANRAQRISAVALLNGRLDVYMIGLDQNMWHSAQRPDGSFPDFAGARVGTLDNRAVAIDAVRMPGGRVEVFMAGTEGRMWRSVQQPNGSFPNFAERPFSCPHNLASSIAVTSFTDGRRDVYIARRDQTIWRNFETTERGWQELTGIVRTRNADTGWYIYYPWAFVAPNGKVFVAGPTRSTFWIDVTGNGSMTLGPQSSVLREYGSAVMYDAGKILILGGGTDRGNVAHNSAQVINLNVLIPTWGNTGSMSHRRKQANATVLANGQVLVIGGTVHGGYPSRAYEENNRAVLEAELWNPATGQFTRMASMQRPRTYHSTAILLPSGQVLAAGGGQGGGPAIDPHPDAEIYSPPYLFRGPRPMITSAPSSIGYNQIFTVTTPDATNISDVTLVRLGSTTHAYDQNQRFNRLRFILDKGSTLRVTAPANGNTCPPGHYMLFILKGNGVPSEAKIIRLGA